MVVYQSSFFVRVVAWNQAGLSTEAFSPVVTIDSLPPLLGGASLHTSPGAQLPVATDLGPSLSGLSTCRCATPFARFDIALGACRCVPGRFFAEATTTCDLCEAASAHADCQPRASIFSWPVSLPACPVCPDGSWRRAVAGATSPCPDCEACPVAAPRFVPADSDPYGDPSSHTFSLLGFLPRLAPVATLRAALGSSNDGGVQHSAPVEVDAPATLDSEVSVSFPLVHGHLITASVAATSAAGVRATGVFPLAVVDGTAPAAGGVSIVETASAGVNDAVPLEFTSHNQSAVVAWTSFHDHTSGVVALRAGLFSMQCSGGMSEVAEATMTDVWTASGGAAGVLEAELASPMYHGGMMYPCVMATNGAGLTTWESGRGATVDLRAPAPGVVFDGVDGETDDDCVLWTGEDGSVGVTWGGFFDATSGLASVQVALGTSSGAADVLQWTEVALSASSFSHPNMTALASAVSAMVVDASLDDSTPPMFWTVKATDGVGWESWASSNGFRLSCVTAAFGDEAELLTCGSAFMESSDSALCVSTSPRVVYTSTTTTDEVVMTPG